MELKNRPGRLDIFSCSEISTGAFFDFAGFMNGQWLCLDVTQNSRCFEWSRKDKARMTKFSPSMQAIDLVFIFHLYNSFITTNWSVSQSLNKFRTTRCSETRSILSSNGIHCAAYTKFSGHSGNGEFCMCVSKSSISFSQYTSVLLLGKLLDCLASTDPQL